MFIIKMFGLSGKIKVLSHVGCSAKCLNFKRFEGSAMRVRQNFSEKCEEALNKQINLELKACHEYLAMAYHFDRSDVASPGIFKFFKKASDDEREHAEKIMQYMNKRGGTIVLEEIPKPQGSYGSAIEAFIAALELEKTVNQALLDMHKTSSDENDANLCDFIEANYLQEQVDGAKVLADFITQLERSEKDLGNYLFDKYMLQLNGAGVHG